MSFEIFWVRMEGTARAIQLEMTDKANLLLALRSAVNDNVEIDDEPHYDHAGKRIPVEFVVQTNNVHETVKLLVSQGYKIAMLGHETCETGNWQKDGKHVESVQGLIGVQPMELKGRTKNDREKSPEICATDEIIIDKEKMTVRAGVGVTSAQVNQTLEEAFKDDENASYYVPLDLTTMDTAQMGGIFATGAQGPSRVRASDIAASVVISDGKNANRITDREKIKAHEGLWGFSGAICEVELHIRKRPNHKFAMFVPLVGTANGEFQRPAADLIAKLYPSMKLRVNDGNVTSEGWSEGFLDGAEVVSASALRLLSQSLYAQKDSQISQNAGSHLNQLNECDAEYGVMVTGYSSIKNDEELMSLFNSDDPKDAEKLAPFLTVMGLSDNENFKPTLVVGDNAKLEEVRALREAIPVFAKKQAKFEPEGVDQLKQRSSVSTDVNLSLDRDYGENMSEEVRVASFALIFNACAKYRSDILAIADLVAQDGVEVSFADYGHWNPNDMDPHMRATVKAKEGNADFEIVKELIVSARNKFMQSLASLSELSNGIINVAAGEKGRVSPDAYELSADTRESIAGTLNDGPSAFQTHIPPVWQAEMAKVRNGQSGYKREFEFAIAA